jgi:hypothetical protein
MREDRRLDNKDSNIADKTVTVLVKELGLIEGKRRVASDATFQRYIDEQGLDTSLEDFKRDITESFDRDVLEFLKRRAERKANETA